MQKLKNIITQAQKDNVAVGHFNISNLEGLWAIFRSAKELSLPVVIGVSEGERDFIGIKQVRSLVTSLSEEFSYPIYLNADHTYSFERVKEVVDAGFDSVIFDGSRLPLEENIKITKLCVDYAKSKNPDILVEGELGYIGTSSKLLDEIPSDVLLDEGSLTEVSEADYFVKETGVDLFSPAVGNIHGMLKNSPNPHLNINLIKSISQAVGIPLVLHGGSGISDDDFRAAILAGISLIHINTELRVAYRNSLRLFLQENPEEIAPYKILKEPILEMKKIVDRRLHLFNGK